MPIDLSVILATSGRFPGIRATFARLQRQTVAAQIELVVVTPMADDFELPPDATNALGAIKVVGLPRKVSIDRANAEGVRHATAPIVVFLEDHVFPENGWAEALLARYGKGDYAGVGPVVRNANPATAVSWADFLLSYGLWSEEGAAGETDMLPGHNSSYRRSILLAQGDRLSKCLEAESVFHGVLRGQGARLFVEPRAIIAHMNFARLDVLLRVQYHYGRSYGACRSRTWPGWKRAFYFSAAPLIPLVRFARILRQGIRIRNGPSRWRVIAVMIPELLADALGQAVGYAIGAGKAAEFLMDYEYDRVRFVSAKDRTTIERASG